MAPELDGEPVTPPKLSLFLLPSKLHEPTAVTATPPIHTSASVPFEWEEAPGKPRPSCTSTTSTKSKPNSARCLELPPRLVKVTNLPSPTTVLDGPYMGRSLSLSHSSSFANGRPGGGGLENLGSKVKKDRLTFGSSRWGSFMRNNKEAVGGRFDFSSSADDIGSDGAGTKAKITRFRRRPSFLSSSSTKSQLWTSVYESFKQVVPWRRRREN